MDNYQYDLNVDSMHEIFKRYGEVLKIAIFQKNNAWQALVQYPDHQVRARTAAGPFACVHAPYLRSRRLETRFESCTRRAALHTHHVPVTAGSERARAVGGVGEAGA